MRATARGAALLLVASICVWSAAPQSALASARPTPIAGTAADFGIEVTAVRLSGAGRIVDFRYRVLDPPKAKQLLSRQIEPYALDQATGARLAVPRSGKVGPLRQTAPAATAGRIYFILFGNTGSIVKRGSLVTVVLGELRLPDLLVE